MTGNTLTVTLSDDANLYVIADAVRIERVGAAAANLDIQTVDVEGQARGDFQATLGPPSNLKYDLNAASSGVTEPGYIGVGSDNGFNSSLGYGWQTLAPAFDRGFAPSPTLLLQDGHYGTRGQHF